jgi:hypothetical protein
MPVACFSRNLKRVGGYLLIAAAFFFTTRCGGSGGTTNSTGDPGGSGSIPGASNAACRNGNAGGTGGSVPDLLYVESATSPPSAGSIITAYCVAGDGSLASLGTAYESSADFGLLIGDASGSHIFAYDSSPSLLTFSVQPSTGKLQQTSAVPFPLGGVQLNALNAAGNLLFTVIVGTPATSIYSSSVLTYAVDSSANLTLLHTTALPTGMPVGLATHPAGTFLYAATFTDNNATFATAITEFAIDGTGALTPVNSLTVPTVAPAMYNYLAIAPNGKALYLGQAYGGAIDVFAIDPASGNLTLTQTANCGCTSIYFVGLPATINGLGIVVNSTGTLLFQATAPVTILGQSYGASGVALYSINPGSGALTALGNSFIAIPNIGIDFAVDRNPAANGNTLLYAMASHDSQTSDEILAFSISDGGTVTALPPTLLSTPSYLMMLDYSPPNAPAE